MTSRQCPKPDALFLDLDHIAVDDPRGAFHRLSIGRMRQQDGEEHEEYERGIYEDQASGKRDDRPGLAACLKALRKGDVLVIWKLGRLGRSLSHLVQTVKDLEQRGIGFRGLTGAPVDTSPKEGKLMFAIFAGAGRVRTRFDRRAHESRAGVGTGGRRHQ